jgi:hypothetical protein
MHTRHLLFTRDDDRDHKNEQNKVLQKTSSKSNFQNRCHMASSCFREDTIKTVDREF